MLMNKEVEAIQSAGLGKGNNFTIAASPKAFEILSSNLYQNKTLAVIREISCNAADAHAMVGKSLKDIIVHLPTFGEPYFSVRDFGPGLSTQDVLDLYTTYFRSTKDNDNSMIGGFGLGSKSPFAVAEQFTVTSWFGGYKSSFVCYKDSGMPHVNEISSVPSAEPSGILVQVAARNYDNWQAEARNFFQWWPELPQINHKVEHLLRPDNILAASKILDSRGIPEWAIVKSYSQPQVFMGLVPYALTTAAIPDLDDATRKVFDNLPLFLRFDVGALSISPSREALSYDKSTSSVLTSKLKSIADEIVDGVKNHLAHCKTLFDARLYVYKEMEKLQGFGQTLVRLASAGKLKWNASPVLLQVTLDLQKDFASPVTTSQYSRRFYSKTWRKGHQDVWNFHHSITRYDESHVFYWAPAITSKVYRTIAAYHDDPDNTALGASAIIITGSSLADVEAVFLAKGLPSVVDIATLPPPPKAARGSSASPKTKGYTIDTRFNYKRDESDIDLTGGGIYFEFKFGDPVDPAAYHVARQARSIGLLPASTVAYGFRKAALKTKALQAKLADNDWLPFGPDWFGKNVDAELLYTFAYGTYLHTLAPDYTAIRSVALQSGKTPWLRPDDEAARQLVLAVKQNATYYSVVGRPDDPFVNYYSPAQKIVLKKAEDDAKLHADILSKFLARHPFLPHVLNGHNQPPLSAYLDYINR